MKYRYEIIKTINRIERYYVEADSELAALGQVTINGAKPDEVEEDTDNFDVILLDGIEEGEESDEF